MGNQRDRQFTLPKNIRQMGKLGETYKIYVEDFVYTYVHRTLREEQEKQDFVAAVLLGRRFSRAGQEYIFISGAQQVDFSLRETADSSMHFETQVSDEKQNAALYLRKKCRMPVRKWQRADMRIQQPEKTGLLSLLRMQIRYFRRRVFRKRVDRFTDLREKYHSRMLLLRMPDYFMNMKSSLPRQFPRRNVSRCSGNGYIRASKNIFPNMNCLAGILKQTGAIWR